MTPVNLLTYRIISAECVDDSGEKECVAEGQIHPKDPVETILAVLRGMQGWCFDEDLTIEITYKGVTTTVCGNGIIGEQRG